MDITSPADSTAEAQPLDSQICLLPAELRLLILKAAPDIRTLVALIMTCKKMWGETYIGREKEIINSVIRNELPLSVQIYETPTWNDVSAAIQRDAEFAHRALVPGEWMRGIRPYRRLCGPFKPDWTLSEALRFTWFRNGLVCRIIDIFIDRCNAYPRAAGKPLSLSPYVQRMPPTRAELDYFEDFFWRLQHCPQLRGVETWSVKDLTPGRDSSSIRISDAAMRLVMDVTIAGFTCLVCLCSSYSLDHPCFQVFVYSRSGDVIGHWHFARPHLGGRLQTLEHDTRFHRAGAVVPGQETSISKRHPTIQELHQRRLPF